MKKNIRYIIAGAFLVFSSAFFQVSAQTVIEIEPLFEYPVAPEDLTSLTDKSNYLVEHFWDAMDFKSTQPVDQNALNDAFKVFSVPLRWSDKAKADAATAKLLENISKNPILMLQFTKAAEETIYGPRAEVWIDEVYAKFLNALMKNKKIPESRKRKYEKQLSALIKSSVGSRAPEFTFVKTDGSKAKYFPMATNTIIIFGDPRDTDWRMKRLRLEANTYLTDAVDKGKINILYIVPSKFDGWEKEISSYPSSWTVGLAQDGLDSVYDMRVTPSVYAVGGDGNIMIKNATVEAAVNMQLDKVK